MIWILGLILLAVLFIDHRVSSLVKINRKILKLLEEIAQKQKPMDWPPK